MKKVIYTGTHEDISKIMDRLVNKGSGVKKQGNTLIVFTEEETRLVKMGEAVVINNGKLM